MTKTHRDAQPEILIAIDYLRDLRAEWAWKNGSSARNTREFQDLCACIERLEKLVAQNDSKP